MVGADTLATGSDIAVGRPTPTALESANTCGTSKATPAATERGQPETGARMSEQQQTAEATETETEATEQQEFADPDRDQIATWRERKTEHRGRVAVVRVMGFGPLQTWLAAGNRFARDEEKRPPGYDDFGTVAGIHIEGDEVDPSPLPHPGDGAGDIEQTADREGLAPSEGLLAVDHRSVEQLGQEVGCDGYLAKPVEPRRVVEEVKKHLGA